MLEGYTLINPIKEDKNSYSDVLLIQNDKTEECYMLKVIKGINTPLHNVLFEREVRALTKLRTCDNIVKLIEFNTIHNEEYGNCGLIFLENIQGETLKDTDVLEYGNIDKYKIIEQLIEAVQVAHENNIIHRDINPKNIMIYNGNKLKLIDFGISKIKDMVNCDTVFQFATNRYAAPEVIQHSENATEQSDIYSIGAVIYYLFTGEEPPLQNKFEEKISSSGMDINLIAIVKKMVMLDIDNRYKDIFEVKKDILQFIKNIIKSDKKYIVKLNSGSLQHMKNTSLVPLHKNYSEILNEDIYNDFLEAYIDFEKLDGDEENYKFYGNSFRFDCIYQKDKQMFLVGKVNKLYPNQRQYVKRTMMKIQGDMEFCNRDIICENDNFELTNDIKSFKVKLNSDANVNNEYSRNFSAWHKLLEIMEEECKNEAVKINYKSFKTNDDYYIFDIKESDYYDLDERINKEIVFICEKAQGKKTIAKEIGTFNKLEINNGKYYLYVKRTIKGNYKHLNKKGIISEDYRRNLSLIKRETKAISAFNNEEYVSTKNLKSIFSQVSDASSFENIDDIEFFDTTLDPTQRRAVKKSLNSQDIALIQGPPGTGKTKVIIEIVRQILNSGNKGSVFKKKILLVSQAHAAVDKMLEDLREANSDNDKVIRVGKIEDLTDIVQENYSIENVQGKWINNVIEKIKDNKNRILKYIKLSEEEFNEYYELKLELESNQTDENNIKNVEKMKVKIKEFEDKYSSIVESKEFKGLIIQKSWSDKIKSNLELERYFIKNAVIVAGTCTGFVSNNSISNMAFDYLIIDEAAKATFPELIISIIKAKKIILVGDHKQLPPVLDENLIKRSRKKFNEDNINSDTLYSGIFLKLFKHLNENNKQTLKTQYRMHPIIGSMISRLFYLKEISNGVNEDDRKHNINEYEEFAVIWIDTSKCKNKGEKEISKTFKNELEANIVREQLKLINKNSNNDIEVGVITPYSAQKNLIKNEVMNINTNNIKGEVAINSVDAFQGGQKDVIIYSTVRSNTKNRIGFLKSEERLNVAFSRAKKLLIIVGDKQFLGKRNIKGNRFTEIIDYIEKNEKCKVIDYKSIQERNKHQ